MWITQARPCRHGKPEPSLADMLSDPMVKAVMAADGIDPTELEAELRSIARTIAAGRRIDRQH
jgi:hypothetical protein